jgi:glycogen phosphorylase
LFAGKAHPADEPGKQVLREIRQLMTTPAFIGRVIFLEDYDLQLARWLVSGVDVWLNNPIAPLEASGTSGIKAATNGRLNLSVLDGWWAEGWMQDNGWGIPPANVQDPERRDAIEAELILDTLEEEVVPLYYDCNEEGFSPEWVRRSKRAMMTVIPQFNMPGSLPTDLPARSRWRIGNSGCVLCGRVLACGWWPTSRRSCRRENGYA